jgi:hypothetical protein
MQPAPTRSLPKSAAAETIVVPLRSKALERVQVLQRLQHAVPATALLPAGIQALLAGAHGFELVLAVAEIVTSAWLLRLMAKEIRSAIRGVDATSAVGGAQHGVDWAHLAAASVIAVEVFERWHLHHRWSRPLILTALLTFALAFLHGRIERLRDSRLSLRVDGSGVSFRARRKKPFTAAYGEIERFDLGARHVTIATADGRRGELDLADLRNAPAVTAAFERARGLWLDDVEARRAAADAAAAAATMPLPASPAGGAASASGAEALRGSPSGDANAGG